MTTLSILVCVCSWVLGSTNWRLLESSWAPLSFSLWIVVKLLCWTCLCLFDAIVQLYAMDGKNVQ